MINRSLSEASAASSIVYQRRTQTAATTTASGNNRPQLTPRQSKTKEHGAIRLYSSDGERSTVATITTATTAGEIAENYKVEAIYLQTGNFHIRELSADARPLSIFLQHMESLGFEANAAKSCGSQDSMRSIIAFFIGRPTLQPNSGIRSEILVTECDVRKGRLMTRWSKNKCVFFNGSIRISRGPDDEEVILLIQKKVDIYESKRGKCLRIYDSVSTILLLFDDSETLHVWLNRCQQNVQSTSSDLSDQRLTLLPESLFTSPESIYKLNLRRNSLQIRRPESPGPILGFLDDLTRLQNLVSLDLSVNKLSEFPVAITELQYLQKLNLSSNRISYIPVEINHLSRLSSLDISNNSLSTLPMQLVECPSLLHLNLSFNNFSTIPSVLTRLDMVKQWLLAGNYIQRIDSFSIALEKLEKLDLRRNCLESTFRLPVGSYDHLTHIDLRDNQNLSAVFLTNTPALKVLLGSRLQLTSIHLNGQSLTHLFVDHNILDSLVIMPIPTQLQVLDVSHNLFDQLPDWISDLPNLTAIRANHNRINILPKRLFSMTSLRLLCLHNNEISSLPSLFEDSPLETVLLQNNCLESLPEDFFKALSRLRQVNLSFNKLTVLPPASPNVDWNKVQVLRAAHNSLDEAVVPVVVLMKRLRTLDLSNNQLRYFDDSALSSLSSMEDLNLSSNILSSISSAIPQLPSLIYFRAHSNRIQSMPDLSQSLTLQLVDLSSNQLSMFPPSMASSPALRSLDISCNPLLQIDTGTIRTRRKAVSLVDVGGSTKHLQFGFAETTGNRNRLCIRRLCKTSIFGLVDGGSNYELPKKIVALLEEMLDITTEINLKQLLMSIHLQLGEQGERLGASVILLKASSSLHLVSSGTLGAAILSKGTVTILETGSVLDDDDYLKMRKLGFTVDENNSINGVTPCPRQLGMYYLHPAVAPNPAVIGGDSEGIDAVILASRALWDHLSSPDIARILSSTVNPQVAAKRLQDALQSCDYLGNSSIIVVKLPKPEVKFDSSPKVTPAAVTAKSSPAALSAEPLLVAAPLRAIPAVVSSPVSQNDTEIQRIEQRLDRISEEIARIDRNQEIDDGHTTGRQLYDRILADELANRSPSSSSGAPPDPKSANSFGAPEDLPPPPPSLPSVSPPSYKEYLENQKFDLGFARKDEGQYSVAEYARKFQAQQTSQKEYSFPSSSSSLYAEDRPSPRTLSVIREISESSNSDLAFDETHSCGCEHNINLTPMEESLSSRYRFEYARSNVADQLKISKNSRFDL